MASADTKKPERPAAFVDFVLQQKWVTKLVMFLFGAVVPVWAFYASSITEPEHGVLVDYRRLVHSADEKEQHVERILQYAVRNPGPGDLENLSLRIKVEDSFNSETESFETGLLVGTIGTAERKISKDDGRTLITIKPQKATGAPIVLSPGASFGISLTSRQKDFDPVSVEIHGLKTVTTQVSQDPLQFSHSNVIYYYLIGVAALVVFGVLVLSMIVDKHRAKSAEYEVAVKVAEQVEENRLKWEEAGRVDYLKDLNDSPPPKDGKSESDRWEGKMKKARQEAVEKSQPKS